MTAAPVEEDLEHSVVALERRSPVIVELTLRPTGTPLDFAPGQYVLLCDRGHEVVERSFSIGNAPRPSGELTLLVTEVPGGEASTWIHRRLRVGDTVLVSGPYGSFVADPESDAPVLHLAGGSGLAPVRALAEAAIASGRPDEVTLFFSARTESDVIDAARFARWERERPGFRFLRTLTRADGPPPVGRVPELLPHLFPDLVGHDVFVAGASGFVDACADAARSCGIHAGRLHTEAFFEEPRPWRGTVPS